MRGKPLPEQAGGVHGADQRVAPKEAYGVSGGEVISHCEGIRKPGQEWAAERVTRHPEQEQYQAHRAKNAQSQVPIRSGLARLLLIRGSHPALRAPESRLRSPETGQARPKPHATTARSGFGSASSVPYRSDLPSVVTRFP